MRHVTIIEDESDIAGLLAHCFALEGFQVTTAGDGETGLDLVRLGRPDIVLLDLLLPRLSGWEVFRALRAGQDTARIPILILTALPTDRVRFLDSGAADFILKPCGVKEVIARVRAVLRRVAPAPAEALRGIHPGVIDL
jgi:two-component system, OmpR family, phosphate regulon response regulator PhoB